jgi:hypothetical protein
MPNSNLVDPVAYFRVEFPEAYDLLPDGDASLEPELALMRQLAKDHGKPVAIDPTTGRVYVPMPIVEYVYGTPLKKEDIDVYLADVSDNGGVSSMVEEAAA